MGIMIVIYIALAFFSLVFRIAGKLRLGVPLLYIVLICTVLQDWADKHETLAIVIFGILIALVAASWIVSIVNFYRSRFGGGREERQMKEVLVYQLQRTQERGIPADRMRINSVGGVPIVEYDRD